MYHLFFYMIMIENKTIRIFHSHIEISPYKKGENKYIERYLSVINYKTHITTLKCFYIEGDILYVPRGISTAVLSEHFSSEPIMMYECDKAQKFKVGDALLPPKSDIQRDGINFLCGEDKYVYTARYSQLGLNLGTGDGKTYGTISTIMKMKLKSIIITHQEKLKQQWIETFKDKTSLPDENIVNIAGTDEVDLIMKGKLSGDIYLVNHQTLLSYAKTHGWLAIRDLFKKIKVGIKVVDEAHKFFENIFMLDCFSNCQKSFYLTATFGRSDRQEVALYKKAFASLVRYGEETANSEEKRKHTNFIMCYFNSKPEYGMTPNIKNKYGLSAYKYIDYELNYESNNSLMKVLEKILIKIGDIEGKVLVLSPTKDSVRFIANKLKEFTNEEVGVIFSDNTKDENDDNKRYRFISSTIKSVGEGFDLPGLRVLINLEPIGSPLLADQVQGRLREYNSTLDTYLFYPVDTTIDECYQASKRILNVMKRKCKSINITRIEV